MGAGSPPEVRTRLIYKDKCLIGVYPFFMEKSMNSKFATFYDVDPEYIRFLQQSDRHVMNVMYANRNKFVYGVVLETNDRIKYYVPVSHYSINKENNILIKIDHHGKTVVAGSLRFNYMFPVPDKCLSVIDFKRVDHFHTNDERIKVEKEYRYIKKKIGIKRIHHMAKKTYDAVVNSNNPSLSKNSCDFVTLEKAYKAYIARETGKMTTQGH